MKKTNSIQTNQEDMAGILQGAISALGGRNGTTKLAILSYIKAENPMLSYPNRHNLVFYLRRAINDAIDNNILQESNGKYKLVSAKRQQTRINKYRDISERSRPGDRVSHKRSTLKSKSLTPIDNELDGFNNEPEDRRHRHGRKRHGRRKGRRGSSRRRRRRYHSHAASDVASNLASDVDLDDPKQVLSKSIQSHTSEKEPISSNAGSGNSSSMDESNSSGSVESVPSALPPS